MIFTQPMIANQTVATPPAQIAAKSDQQRASGRAPYTFGQLAQATPGSSAGSGSGTADGQQRADTGRRKRQPAQLRRVAEPELDGQRNDHAGRQDGRRHDGHLGQSDGLADGAAADRHQPQPNRNERDGRGRG